MSKTVARYLLYLITVSIRLITFMVGQETYRLRSSEIIW